MAELTIEQLKEQNRQLQLEIELKKELIKTEKKLLAEAVKRQAAAEKTADAQQLDEATADIDRQTARIKAQIEAINGLTEAKERNAAAEVELQKEQKVGEELFESLRGSLFGLEGGFEKVAQFASLGGSSLSSFGASALESVASGQLLKDAVFKVAQELTDFALEADRVTAEFRKSTGAGREFDDTIRNVGLNTIAIGASLEDAAQAVGALKNEFTDFTYLSEQQQGAIAETTVQLNRLGFSFANQAEVIQTATQALGMDVDQANDLLIDLASTARSLGVDVDTLGGQFAANKDFLVRFGDDSQKAFEELAVTAKALGTELGTLVEVVDKFKTFDQAGETVGRLNAILGGPFLNSMDMLNASFEDPIEGIMMLRDGFEQAGVSIEDVSGAQLEAFASALGLSATKTKELLGESNEQLEIQRMNQEEMAEAARQSQAAMDQLSNAFRQMMIAGKPLIDNLIVPIIEGIGSFAGFIAGASSALGRFVGVGLAAAGIAALVAAPFTGGASLLTYAAIAGAGGIAAFSGGGSEAPAAATPTPGFRSGGTITTEQAMVHPGELLITGGQGSEVISQELLRELIDTVKNQSQGPQQISVHVGNEKLEDFSIRALNSEKARSAFSPYSNA